MKNAKISKVMFYRPARDSQCSLGGSAVIFYESGYRKTVKFWLGQVMPKTVEHFVFGSYSKTSISVLKDGTHVIEFQGV